jgi:F1F0 ATPase subunit 2
MNEIIFLVWAFILGLVLGTLFFGGLRITVKKAVASKIPALWFVGSFFLRAGIILLGFYYISQGNLQRLLICVLGFIVARYIIIRITRVSEEKQIQLKKEISNET